MDICVFASSSDRLDGVYYAGAERLGSLMAEEGFGLIFGGGREGLMGAVAKGAHSSGGRITGIAPGFFNEPGILFDDCALIFTETMNERKNRMEDMADAFIVLPGGSGTLEEFFEVFTLKQLGRNDKAIVLLNTAGYFTPLMSLLDESSKKGFISKRSLALIHVADTPEDALGYIKVYKPQTGDLYRLSDYGK